MSGMAEVLAGHREPSWRAAHGGWDCACGHTLTSEYPSLFPREVHEQHVAAMLTAAGFGPVKEAGAVALEEAAKTIEGYAKDGADGDTSPYETATWLRARAAKICADVA